MQKILYKHLFVVAHIQKNWKQSTYLSIEEWLDKYVFIMHLQDGILQQLKRVNRTPVVQEGFLLGIIM